MQGPLELRSQDLREVTFLGTVVENNDPLKAGRVKVRVSKMYDQVSDSDLPWALPDRGFSPAGNFSPGTATTPAACGIPSVGSTVNVYFQHGNPHEPVYGSDVVRANVFSTTIFGPEYPNAWGFSDGNNYVKVNRATGDIQIVNAAGSFVKVNASGEVSVSSASANVTVSSAADVSVTAASKITANASSEATITVGASKVEVTTSEVKLTGGGATVKLSGGNVLLNVP